MNNTTTESREDGNRGYRVHGYGLDQLRVAVRPPTGSMRPNDRWEWGSQILLILDMDADTEAEGEAEVEVEG